jgi:hypothetical protein
MRRTPEPTSATPQSDRSTDKPIMPRYRKPPLTLADLEHDGPPVRLRDLVAITGFSSGTIRWDILNGNLPAQQRARGTQAWWFIKREDARAYAAKLGIVVSNMKTA